MVYCSETKIIDNTLQQNNVEHSITKYPKATNIQTQKRTKDKDKAKDTKTGTECLSSTWASVYNGAINMSACGSARSRHVNSRQNLTFGELTPRQHRCGLYCSNERDNDLQSLSRARLNRPDGYYHKAITIQPTNMQWSVPARQIKSHPRRIQELFICHHRHLVAWNRAQPSSASGFVN